MDLKSESEKESIENFTEMLVFLDYLEMIAKLVDTKSLEKKVVIELLGASFEYYYGIFKKYIASRRQKYQNENYCKEFKKQAELTDN